MSAERHDPTDWSDAHWQCLEPLFPERPWHSGGRGRPPRDRRCVLNGLFYRKKTGWQWRMLPKEFGKWSTISGYCKRGRRDAIWESLLAQLRQRERLRRGRQPAPSAGSRDSQRIKTATQADASGSDGHTKVKGRTRPLFVETLGLIIAVVVTAAHVEDRQGLLALLTNSFAEGVTRLRKMWVEGGYQAGWLDLEHLAIEGGI